MMADHNDVADQISRISISSTKTTAYVPPHLRNAASKPAPVKEVKKTLEDLLPSRPEQPSKFQSWSSTPQQRQPLRHTQSRNAPRKDPSDEFYSRPDVQGRDPRIEEKLYGFQQNSGINFDRYEDIPVEVSGSNPPEPIMNFQESNMDDLAKSNVKLAGYSNATPIQRYSVSVVTVGRDLMACAQTGSGKVNNEFDFFRQPRF